jgi:type I restriction enzyme S subunit
VSFTESLEVLVAQNRSGLLGRADHWARVPLGWVAQIVNGHPFPSSQFDNNSGFPLLRIRDLLNDSTEAFFTGDVPPEYVVNPGDLVVGMDGDFNCALWQGPPAALNQRVCRISPDKAFYDQRFLSLVLSAYLKAINEATSSITVKHLSSRTIAEIPLPLPPLAEQHRIVSTVDEHLSRLDASIAGLKRVQALTPQYNAAVLNAAFDGPVSKSSGTKRDLSPEAEESEGWPAGLEHIRRTCSRRTHSGWPLVSALAFTTDSGYGTSDKCEYLAKGPPVLRIPNIVSGRIDLGDVKRARREHGWAESDALAPGDLLVIRTNGSRSLIGRSAVVSVPIQPPHYYASYLIRLRLLPDPVLWAWIGMWWSSPKARELLEAMAATSAGQYNVSLAKLRTLEIPLPTKSKAMRIIAEVEHRRSVADAMRNEVHTLLSHAASLRQSILKRAFDGKLVPQDPTDEPASVLLERIRSSRAGTPTRSNPVRKRA